MSFWLLNGTLAFYLAQEEIIFKNTHIVNIRVTKMIFVSVTLNGKLPKQVLVEIGDEIEKNVVIIGWLLPLWCEVRKLC